MRWFPIKAVMLAVVMLANCRSAPVHNGRTAIRVVVPFEFYAAETRLAAGTYLVHHDRIGEIVLNDVLRGQATHTRILGSLPSSVDHPLSGLVFVRYGEDSFLAEVWLGSDGRRLQVNGAATEGSSHGRTAERVVVAGKLEANRVDCPVPNRNRGVRNRTRRAASLTESCRKIAGPTRACTAFEAPGADGYGGTNSIITCDGGRL